MGGTLEEKKEATLEQEGDREEWMDEPEETWTDD